MLNWLPEPLRKLLSLPPVYRYPVRRPSEWRLYSMAMTLGVPWHQVYGLMDGGPLPKLFRYRHFTVPKKNGDEREIVEPGVALKAIQRKILKLYLNRRKPHQAALGFRRKKSIADHAWAHAGAGIIITADIQDFFPSTKRQRVKAWWHTQGYSTLEVRLLTTLTTYRGSLPQGAPTSPALSNLINADLDAAIERRIKASGGRYTRYADDMVFSWPVGSAPPADFQIAVTSLLREAGYTLHPQKGWCVWYRQDEPQVTGLVLSQRGQVDIPEAMQRIMRELSKSQDEHDRARLGGYIGYREMVTKQPQRVQQQAAEQAALQRAKARKYRRS